MTLFDIFILSIVGLSAVFAWVRGISRETITLVAIALGVVADMMFGETISGLLGDGTFSLVGGYVLLFLVVFLVAHIALELALGRFVGPDPKLWDRIAGAGYGVVRGWLLLGLVYLALNIYFDEENLPDWLENSALKGPIAVAGGLFEQLGLKPLGPEPDAGDGESSQTEPV